MVGIRPVQYLLARGAGDQWSGLELENLPKGGNLGLEISQHDSLGIYEIIYDLILNCFI